MAKIKKRHTMWETYMTNGTIVSDPLFFLKNGTDGILIVLFTKNDQKTNHSVLQEKSDQTRYNRSLHGLSATKRAKTNISVNCLKADE